MYEETIIGDRQFVDEDGSLIQSNKRYGAIDAFVEEAYSHKLLSDAETEDLLLQIKSTEDAIRQNAVDKLYCHNLRRVLFVANTLAGPGRPMDILISSGLLGLMVAIEEYEFGKGTKFGSFAHTVLRNRMINAIRDYHAKNRTKDVTFSDVYRDDDVDLDDTLSQEAETSFSIEDLIDLGTVVWKKACNMVTNAENKITTLRITPEDWIAVERLLENIHLLSTPGDVTFYTRQLNVILAAFSSTTLSQKQLNVFNLTMLHGMNQDEIALKLDISQQAVSKLLGKVTSHLSASLKIVEVDL